MLETLQNQLPKCVISKAHYSTVNLLLDHGLPLALALSDGEAVDLGLDLCPPLTHVVLNVEHKGVLAEVCIHHLPWSLKTHGRVQVRLQQREITE